MAPAPERKLRLETMGCPCSVAGARSFGGGGAWGGGGAEVGGAVDVHVQPADSADKFALYLGLHIAKNETFACTALKLCPGDALYVTSANGSHTFTVFSDEV